MRRERVLVLHNQPVLPVGHPDYESEIEVLENVEAISAVLAANGYDVSRLGVAADPQALISGVRGAAPDAVVNLFEGTGDNNVSELYACGLLEWLGVSYTGCPFHTLVLARSKHLAKRMFAAEGLPTPAFFVVEPGERVEACSLTFPVICKPAAQDASVGLTQQSVVTDLASLQQRVAWLIDQFQQPVLVEEFIRGREITVALAELPELRLLPGTEVIFENTDPGYWPIMTYDAKWSRETNEYDKTDFYFDAPMSPELAGKIDRAAKRAFRLLGARDYARVDFRVRQGTDEPYMLELNPNPDFSPDKGMANNLWAADITHADFTLQLVRNALARRGSSAPARFAPSLRAS